MIGNITNGSGARGVLNYVTGREKEAEYVGGTMAGQTARELAAEFKATRQMKPEAVNPVKHYSLSLPPGERLSAEKWEQVASGYMKGMGYDGAQWVAFRHSDKEHDHIHIVASRIRLDGSLVRDYRDFNASQEVLRGIEREHGLTLQTSSKDREFQVKQNTQGEAKFEERTGRNDLSTRKELQGIVSEAMKGKPTMSEFVDRLENRGVTVKANVQSTGRLSGLSYQIRDRVMKGSDLGKSFTAAAVQKAVSYEPKRDLPALTGERVKGVQVTQKAADQARDAAKVAPQSQEAKEAWNEARGHREAMQKLSNETRDKQANLSAELKAAMAGKRALAQERWEAVKPLRGEERKEAWAKFDGRIQRQTEKIQAIKLDQAVTRSEATTKRMDLMEARYRAELHAVSATHPRGTNEHSKAMEKAGTSFLREAKGYAETLRKGVEGRIDRAEKNKRETGLYIDKAAQRIEAIKGAGSVAAEAIKGGWKALANQAGKAKELYQAGKAAVTEKTPEAWKKFQQVLKDSWETFKDNLREARAAVKEARSHTIERVKDKDEQTRADAIEMRAERVIREQTREHGGNRNVGTGRREDGTERATEARSESRTEPGTRERADAAERPSTSRGTNSEQQPGTPGGNQSSRDGSTDARGVDAGGSSQEQRPGTETAHGKPSEIQRDIAGPGRRESDLERSPERGGLAQEAARDTQGRGGRFETPVAGGAGSREQGREGSDREGQSLAHRGPDPVRPEQHDKRPDRLEPRREGPGEGSGSRTVEGSSRATAKQQEALKQYADILKGGGPKRSQEPVKVPHGMKKLEERIHRTEAALKAQGLDSPFTKEALQAAANRGVEKILEAYEKAGLFGDKPNRAELMKTNEKQHKEMGKEMQGPEKPGP